jgi:hypothetical protein
MLIWIFSTAAISSCKKEKSPPFQNNARIIGYDMRLCVCCGGYQIIIDGIPNPNGNTFFLTGQFPANFHLNENPAYPIPVQIDWKADTARCFGNYINISRIARW